MTLQMTHPRFGHWPLGSAMGRDLPSHPSPQDLDTMKDEWMPVTSESLDCPVSEISILSPSGSKDLLRASHKVDRHQEADCHQEADQCRAISLWPQRLPNKIKLHQMGLTCSDFPIVAPALAGTLHIRCISLTGNPLQAIPNRLIRGLPSLSHLVSVNRLSRMFVLQ